MKRITFQSISLSVVESTEYVFLMSSKDTAIGYGVSEKTLRDHKKRQSDELIEGKHFIIDRSYRNTPKTMWTKHGIVRLGFFIKSEKAKAFRDWAEDYVIEGNPSDSNLKQIVILQNEQMVQMSKEINHLKSILIKFHDGYHKILTTCSPIQMIDELRKMTNTFQLIGSTKSDGKNLNTETISGHKYWGFRNKIC